MSSKLTTQKWHDRADSNMMQAQRAHDAAMEQSDRSRRAHEEAVNNNHDMYNDLNSNLEQKVADSHNLVQQLQQRAHFMENSIQHTRQSLAELETAMQAKDPPLQLCLWRMEQRTRRPGREQVRDIVEVALEEERTKLTQLKWELSDAAERTRTMIADLERKLGDVRQDIEHKSHALGIDEMCLATAQSSFLAVSMRTPRPAVVGSKRSSDRFAYLDSHNNEQRRQHKSGALDRSAADSEDLATTLRDDNQALVMRCAIAASEAKSKTDRAFQDRVNESQRVRMRLEDEIRETDAKIDVTNNTISDTRHHIGALQEPMAMTNTCSHWRKERTAPEHITDPVATSLQEHHDTLLRAHEDLTTQHQAEKVNLQNLWARRKQLSEDLKDKTAAQQIDSRCLSHGGAPRGSSRVRDLDTSVNPMPLPIHGEPIPGARPTINGFGAPVSLPFSNTAPGRGATMRMPANVLPTLGNTMLARNGQGTMTPRGFGSAGFGASGHGATGFGATGFGASGQGTMAARGLGATSTVFPLTARAAMTF
mmetsp:Transcript_138911/g.387399  ORF Transcript_138911/g.387399 Transcript_138911/m.387399 type:complete len:536 (-) Transcript_138911:385-1992(-)